MCEGSSRYIGAISRSEAIKGIEGCEDVPQGAFLVRYACVVFLAWISVQYVIRKVAVVDV
jgi:hypothetical protein